MKATITDLWHNMLLREPDDPSFKQEITADNMTRLRLLAFCLIVIMTLVALMDITLFYRRVQSPLALSFSPHIDVYVNALRIAVALVSALFLAFSARIEAFVSDKRKLKLLTVGYPLLVLILLGLVNGLLEITDFTIPDSFILAGIVVAAFLYYSIGEFLILFLVPDIVEVVSLSMLLDDPMMGLARSLNIAIILMFAFMISRTNYMNRIRVFDNLHTISQQKTELEVSNNLLLRLSYLDAPTEIANRRYFDEVIESEWRRAARTETPLSLMMVDIDYFKQYNDTYGHQAGDECLKAVANTLSKIIRRPGDMLARYGGEEFAVILPNTDYEGAIRLADAMCHAVESLKLPSPYSPHRVLTISLGLAVKYTPEVSGTPDALLRCADEALYKAKDTGRNRYVSTLIQDDSNRME